VNHYVRAVRGFFRWLVRAKRVGSNPVETLTLVNDTADVRRARRELTADEMRSLLAATRGSARRCRGLSGDDRFHLYLTAVGTGDESTTQPQRI
jgi:site-specific recombinase XerC